MAVSDWKRRRTEDGVGINAMEQLRPDTVQAVSAICEAGDGSGHLDSKTRSLIATAVAVQMRCDGCIATYTEAARQAGATREEIAEALSITVSVSSRSALLYTTRALEAYASATDA